MTDHEEPEPHPGDLDDDLLPRWHVLSGAYIASRASLPERSATWRRLRDVDGWKISSSWIDEAGAGETAELIEVGMALAHRIPIRVVAPGVVLDPVSFRPIGSWPGAPWQVCVDMINEVANNWDMDKLQRSDTVGIG